MEPMGRLGMDSLAQPSDARKSRRSQMRSLKAGSYLEVLGIGSSRAWKLRISRGGYYDQKLSMV